jgi:ADP-ribose pyrophosphatase YjhB (NUDIX family)
VNHTLREVIYQVAAELRSLASVGLAHSSDPYDIERYHRIHSASARLSAAADSRVVEDEPHQFQDNLHHISPQVGCDALVVRDAAVLLVQRVDNRLWCLPGGWVEAGETLAEATLRELREEAGLNGKPLRLLGVFDSRLWRSLVKVHMYHFITEVHVENPEPVPGIEAIDAGFFGEGALPPLSPGHAAWIPVVFRALRGEIQVPYMDLPPS